MHIRTQHTRITKSTLYIHTYVHAFSTRSWAYSGAIIHACNHSMGGATQPTHLCSLLGAPDMPPSLSASDPVGAGAPCPQGASRTHSTPPADQSTMPAMCSILKIPEWLGMDIVLISWTTIAVIWQRLMLCSKWTAHIAIIITSSCTLQLTKTSGSKRPASYF